MLANNGNADIMVRLRVMSGPYPPFRMTVASACTPLCVESVPCHYCSAGRYGENSKLFAEANTSRITVQEVMPRDGASLDKG